MQANDEKQRLLIDASKQMRDAVAGVKAEFQQAQAMAVQEALKECNAQSSSKEVRQSADIWLAGWLGSYVYIPGVTLVHSYSSY